ncbi:MSMEG_0565 family glycosyltransferase [Paenibacillus sp. Soil787]|uniref:MSMEG_0565 family glycosyltransferase n=1 Tax=Paenibacillus sp. Soil787 TaxID=1736411 RepID=UPI0006FA55D4|nr:MSMEG_0565 family glycosyltransferase [Paenibacillus sp. Soil787]KRF41920.1 glycosyl transferase family 1 [Paenibacillus sp. Soil787]
MRIALYTYNTKPRGGVVHTLALAEALKEQGCSVTVFALGVSGEGQFFRPVRTETKVFPFAAQQHEAFESRILRYIDTYEEGLSQESLEAFDIHHVQDCISANALHRLMTQGRIPFFVRTVHHLDDFTTPALIDCQKKSVMLPESLVTVSEAWQQRLQFDYGRSSSVIHNGVESRFFQSKQDQAELKVKYGLLGKTVFLTIGGIEPRKNTISTLLAFERVKETIPDAELLIVGGSTLFDYKYYLEHFNDLLRSMPLSIQKAVRIIGSPDNETVQEFYRLADCYVQPSKKEGWGLALLEAMATRTPVVASTIDVFQEFMRDGYNALLADPEDIPAIAAKMTEAVSEKDRSRLMTMNGYETASQYTWAKAAEKHIEFYERRLMSHGRITESR